ncbi:DISARM system phospholipase D-like protein DrmC [Schaalia hyovaginalis]|uniref:DISARM system phospholipase D-like protein DrmC n=1 Tax=Schaalia hyovaginalis TaxID=29316 RepID=UPI001F2A43A3|nr:DISARM system phospholipase D-like protein DrmC [Schaalia hyovaginalis]
MSDGMNCQVGEALEALGVYLTRIEAEGIAMRLASGSTLSQALGVVPDSRRSQVRRLFEAAGLGIDARELTIAVLRAVAGSAGRITVAEPIWTAPAGLLGTGALTADAVKMVSGALSSVVCATFNLQPSSGLWKALRALVEERPGVSVRLYVDAQAADGVFSDHPAAVRVRSRQQRATRGYPSPLGTLEIARSLPGASVLRTRRPEPGERAVTSHAKFLSVDHRYLLVGSANFSYSAEERNVELGLLVDDPALAASVERQMRDLETNVYEEIRR